MGIQPNKLHQRLPFPSLPTSQQHSHPHSFKNPHCHYIVLTPRIYLKAQLNKTIPPNMRFFTATTIAALSALSLVSASPYNLEVLALVGPETCPPIDEDGITAQAFAVVS